MNSAQLILSAQRAMLFNISPKFRMLSLEVDGDQILKMLIVSLSELTNDEKDLAYSIAGEIEGDFIIDKGEIDNVKRLSALAYASCE